MDVTADPLAKCGGVDPGDVWQGLWFGANHNVSGALARRRGPRRLPVGEAEDSFCDRQLLFGLADLQRPLPLEPVSLLAVDVGIDDRRYERSPLAGVRNARSVSM